MDLFSLFALSGGHRSTAEGHVKSLGLNVLDRYMGSGGHAHDVHTTAASKLFLMSQALVVTDFTENACLNLAKHC